MTVSETKERPPTAAAGGAERFWLGDWLVVPEATLIERQEQRVHLEPRVMDVLRELCARAGEVVSAEDLLTRIWRGTFYGDNPVHKSIAQLRRALGDSATSPEYIETVRKRGYRIITAVRQAQDTPGRASEPEIGWSGGNPFRGLRAFEEGHAAVFYGRDAAIGRVVGALRRQLDDGLGLLLLLGPSGSGKTSLIRAGVLPLLQRRHGLDGLRVAASARLDASVGASNVIAALAKALLDWRIGTRPVFLEAEQEWLGERLREAPDTVVHRVHQALRRDRDDDSGCRDLLLLIVDQSESVLAGSSDDDEDLAALAQVLDSFARSGDIAVVLSCRSDFYPTLLRRLPVVLALKGAHGHVDLAPMSAGELALCIRGPARVAGLSFEVDEQSQMRLDDCLRDDAIGQPESLPLLQHALDRLYAERSPQGRLGFAAYRQMGGLAGAIASRAEDVHGRLDPAARDSLPRLLERIVTLHPEHGAVVARQIELGELDPDDPGRRLIEAFVEARLFVSVLEHDRHRIGIAHEALLRHWPRVRDWIERNRQRLQAHARIAHATQRWQQEQRRNDLLLHSERQIGEARELYTRAPELLNDGEREFVRRSLHQNGRRRRLRVAALSIFVAVAAIAALMGVRANLASAEAERRREEAESLVEFLLGDLAERLRPLGRLDVLASVAERALQSLQPGRDTHASSQALQQRARALATLGEVLLDQGDSTRAATAFEQAAQTLAPMLQRDQVEPALLETAGNIAFWQGMVDYQARRFDAAQVHLQRYVDLSQRRMDKQPDEPRAWLELSYALNNLGTLEHDQRNNARAIELFETSLDLKRRYAQARPDEAAMQAELADTLSWLGSALEREGRLHDAAELYEQELTILGQLAEAEPNDARWRNRLALSRVRNGSLELALGRVGESGAQLSAAVISLTALIDQDPNNASWQRDLAHARMQWATTLIVEGNRSLALGQLKAANSTLLRVTTASDAPIEWQLQATLSRARLALAALGSDPALAISENDEIESQLIRLNQIAASDGRMAHVLATTHIAVGDIYFSVEKLSQARSHWAAAVELLEFARDSRDRHLIEPLARALIRLQEFEQASLIKERLLQTGNRNPLLTH